MQTTTVFTKHFTDSGENARGGWTRNDFRTEDGSKFSTFDAAVASQALALLEQPVLVTYETSNPQYPNSHDLKAVEVFTPTLQNGGSAEGFTPPEDPKYWPSQPPAGQIKPVDRNAGLARAIEMFGIAGKDPFANWEELFELADVFVAYSQGEKPSFSTAEGPSV
jgi:hypothetical protein